MRSEIFLMSWKLEVRITKGENKSTINGSVHV